MLNKTNRLHNVFLVLVVAAAEILLPARAVKAGGPVKTHAIEQKKDVPPQSAPQTGFDVQQTNPNTVVTIMREGQTTVAYMTVSCGVEYVAKVPNGDGQNFVHMRGPTQENGSYDAFSWDEYTIKGFGIFTSNIEETTGGVPLESLCKTGAPDIPTINRVLAMFAAKHGRHNKKTVSTGAPSAIHAQPSNPHHKKTDRASHIKPAGNHK